MARASRGSRSFSTSVASHFNRRRLLQGSGGLVTALALWFGMTQDFVQFLALTGIYGAVLTLLVVGFRRIVLLPGIAGRIEWLLRLHDTNRGVPYGITLAIAALHVYPHSAWFGLLV